MSVKFSTIIGGSAVLAVVGVAYYILKRPGAVVSAVGGGIKAATWDLGTKLGEWSYKLFDLGELKAQSASRLQSEYAAKRAQLAAAYVAQVTPINQRINYLNKVSGPPEAFAEAQQSLKELKERKAVLQADRDLKSQELVDAYTARMEALNDKPNNFLEYTPIGGLARLF